MATTSTETAAARVVATSSSSSLRPAGRVYLFGNFKADPARFELRRADTRVSVQPIVLDTLFYLLENPGRLISKRELMLGPWNGTSVTATAIRRVVMLARTAIDDEQGATIVTVHGRGYRFEGVVTAVTD